MMKKDYMQETVNYILYYGTKISSTNIVYETVPILTAIGVNP